jgi:hypothetical protein
VDGLAGTVTFTAAGIQTQTVTINTTP